VEAAVLALKTRDENVSGVVGQVLTNMSMEVINRTKTAQLLMPPKMDWFWEQYLPNAEPEVYASPLLANDLPKLPPACECLA
jgi:acetyl esterase/lipase